MARTFAATCNDSAKLRSGRESETQQRLVGYLWVSGQLMVKAPLEAKAKPEEIARCARCRAKQKIPEIIAALEEHRMSDHHRKMIRFSLEHLKFREQQIVQLDQEIVLKIQQLGYIQQWERLQTIPGLQQTRAANVLAEVGPDMQQFASQKHISLWAGICPGNKRSAGKDKGGKRKGGNRWLRTALTECTWAVLTKRDGALKERFWRLSTKKRHKTPAVVAVAHVLLVLVHQVLRTRRPYQEHGVPVLDEQQKNRLIRHHMRRLGNWASRFIQ